MFFLKKKISSRYLFIELAARACLICILASNDVPLVRLTFLFYGWPSTIVHDRYRTRTSTRLDTLPLLWIGLIVNLYFPELVPLSAAVLGATLGYETFGCSIGSINF